MRSASRWGLAMLVCAAAASNLSAQTKWMTYGGNDWNQRYSTLTAINATNVKSLVPRLVFQTGISKLGSFENTPIVVENMMYVTTPYNTLIAYNLDTGKQVWRYEHKLGTTIFCCGPNNRGVGVHGPHVYMGTLDAHLIAFDRMSGDVVWDNEVADPAFGYSITHAPLVIGNNVIIGVSGGEYGIRGHVTAYDAVTGKQVWRWYSIPAPKGDPTFDEAAPNGWYGNWVDATPEGNNLNRNTGAEKSDSAKYADAWTRGGGGVWMTPAYDQSLGLIYVAVGNPSPDLDGSVRPGDNLYTDCVVAIEATTGKTKWYYQTVPHDVWDLDAVSPPVVTTLGGKKVVVHAGKTAWVYVLDAATGTLVRKTENFTPQENMFAQPTASGSRMLPGRQRRCRVVADRGGSQAQLRLRSRPPSADELHHPQRRVGQGKTVARFGLRRDRRRGAVWPVHGAQPRHRQEGVAGQGASADDGRSPGDGGWARLHRRRQREFQRLRFPHREAALAVPGGRRMQLRSDDLPVQERAVHRGGLRRQLPAELPAGQQRVHLRPAEGVYAPRMTGAIGEASS